MGLTAQTVADLWLAHGTATKADIVLVVALGVSAWIVPAAAAVTQSFRIVTVVWIAAMAWLAIWLLPFTILSLVGAACALATRRPSRSGAAPILLATLIGTIASATVYAVAVVPVGPADLHVCLAADDDDFSGSNAVFDVANGTGVTAVMSGDDEVVIAFEPWASQDDVRRVVNGVSQIPTVVNTSFEGCGHGT